MALCSSAHYKELEPNKELEPKTMPALSHQKEIVKEILTVKDVAAALGIGTERVYQLLQAGELPSIRVGSKQGGVRIPRQAFEEYLHGLNEAARASVAAPVRATRSLKDIFQASPVRENAAPASAAALIELLTPTPEQQTALDQAHEGFLMGIRNAMPR